MKKMPTYLHKKNRVFSQVNEKPLSRKRTESRIKKYCSCADGRIWELCEESRRQGLQDVYKLKRNCEILLGTVIPFEMLTKLIGCYVNEQEAGNFARRNQSYLADNSYVYSASSTDFSVVSIEESPFRRRLSQSESQQECNCSQDELTKIENFVVSKARDILNRAKGYLQKKQNEYRAGKFTDEAVMTSPECAESCSCEGSYDDQENEDDQQEVDTPEVESIFKFEGEPTGLNVPQSQPENLPENKEIFDNSRKFLEDPTERVSDAATLLKHDPAENQTENRFEVKTTCSVLKHFVTQFGEEKVLRCNTELRNRNAKYFTKDELQSFEYKINQPPCSDEDAFCKIIERKISIKDNLLTSTCLWKCIIKRQTSEISTSNKCVSCTCTTTDTVAATSNCYIRERGTRMSSPYVCDKGTSCSSIAQPKVTDESTLATESLLFEGRKMFTADNQDIPSDIQFDESTKYYQPPKTNSYRTCECDPSSIWNNFEKWLNQFRQDSMPEKSNEKTFDTDKCAYNYCNCCKHFSICNCKKNNFEPLPQKTPNQIKNKATCTCKPTPKKMKYERITVKKSIVKESKETIDPKYKKTKVPTATQKQAPRRQCDCFRCCGRKVKNGKKGTFKTLDQSQPQTNPSATESLISVMENLPNSRKLYQFDQPTTNRHLPEFQNLPNELSYTNFLENLLKNTLHSSTGRSSSGKKVPHVENLFQNRQPLYDSSSNMSNRGDQNQINFRKLLLSRQMKAVDLSGSFRR